MRCDDGHHPATANPFQNASGIADKDDVINFTTTGINNAARGRTQSFELAVRRSTQSVRENKSQPKPDQTDHT